MSTARTYTRGERVCGFLEKHCRSPEGDHVGKLMVLEPFERDWILAVYDNPHGTSKGILSMARKNGKSTLVAGIVLAHVAGPEARQNSQIISGAMSQRQAAIIFKYAWKMIQMSPELLECTRVKPSLKIITGLARNVEYSAISREKKTAHGLSPVLSILDEVGQIRGPQDDFVEAVLTAQGAYEDALTLMISTQAASDGDYLSIVIDDALSSRDPHTVAHVHAAPADCDLMDEDAWKAANPALGVFRSLKDVREQALAAVRMPSAEAGFRNLTLNQRVETFSPFISKGVWIANSFEPDDNAFLKGEVWCGLDLSARIDLTAFVMATAWEGRWHVKAFFWAPEKGLQDRSRRDRQPYDLWARQGILRATPGASVDYSQVAGELAEITEGIDVRGIAYDRWRMDVMTKALESINLDLPLIPWGQGYKDMSPAVDALECELLNDRISHGNNPILTMCASNATVCKNEAGNRKINKSKSTGRIDGIIALTMAIGLATREIEETDISACLQNPIITRPGR